MQNKVLKAVKATIIDLIVAFLIALLFAFLVKISLGEKIDMAISLISKVSTELKTNTEVIKMEVNILNSGKPEIKTYPSYGQKYASLNIASAGIELPVYFGDSLEVLKNGVGHSSGSYFPGEGGSIIYCAHNSKDKFRNFSKIKKGDKIVVTTEYGTFNYKVYDMQVIEETQKDKLPVQKDEEILMLYTCYPFDALGYTTKRYAVYAKFVDWQANK
ncbi:MAG: class D sortase [Clostridia bacterium]